MGLTKTEGYSSTQIELASLFKALAHPARIAIIEQIIKTESCICNDLVQELPLSQATISQHLKALKQVGIIQGSISGTSMCYCINSETWAKIQGVGNTFLSSYSCADNCC